MRKIALAIALALGLAGCANLQNAYNTLTGARVNPQAVYVAINSFDAIKRTATNYLILCHQHPDNKVCNKGTEAAVASAVRKGTVARNDLRAFLKSHPDALGAQGLYDAVVQAAATVKEVTPQ